MVTHTICKLFERNITNKIKMVLTLDKTAPSTRIMIC